MNEVERMGIESDSERYARSDYSPAFQAPPLRLGLFLRGLALSIAAGLFLGILGPYGSYQNPGLFERVTYWIVSIMMGLGVYAGPMLLLRRARIVRRGRFFWTGVIAGTALLSLLQTLVTRELASSIWPKIASHLPGWWVWYVQVLAIALPSVLAVMLWQWRHDRDVSAGRARARPKDTPSPPADLLLPLPEQPALAGAQIARLCLDTPWPQPERIDALQMEDHYIRCHLVDGSRLIHGVFREAVARQAGCNGLRVHRSWWVARHAVFRWEGAPRSMRLHLRNGMIVPVARAQVARLREAGWLDPS